MKLPAPSDPVTPSDIAPLWASIRDSTPDPRQGIFGPSSISWKVNREAALFLGAGRASLLQLAHPWVAAALDQHSNLRSDPLARFHNTFRVVFTMLFGTRGQALASSQHLYQLHTRIQGPVPESAGAWPAGSKYRANEVPALVWVYATLIESALLAYDAVLPPLTPAERETYYAESKRMAALFGIPGRALPPDWAGFETYMQTMYDSNQLAVNHLSLDLARRVMHGRGSWVPVPGWYRHLTTAWMPERLRGEFALAFGPREQASAARAARWLPRLYPRLPSVVRYVGPYREAQARLAAKSIGPSIRASNRFWMGQPRTMFSESCNVRDSGA